MRMITLLGLIQAVGPVPPAADGSGCQDDPSAIMVCGRKTDPNRYRMPALPAMPEQDSILPRADFGLFGNVRGSVDTEQVEIGPGAFSNRLMARLKIPLGR